MQQLTFGQEIQFDLPSGFYDAGFELVLTTPAEGAIHYTLDGTNPSIQSPMYTQAIQVEERNDEPNSIANIPTNPATTSDHQIWRKPQISIPKSRLVKAALFRDGIQVSPVYYEEYFIGGQLSDIQLPIFSIVIDSVELFDYDKGLYVPGRDFDNNPFTWQPGNYFERGDEWERIMSLSFYKDRALVLKQSAQVEIHGGGSRIFPCKSLRLSAKASLGNRYFENPFFEDRPWDSYKRMILRNGGQDWLKTIFTDVLLHELLKKQNIETQASLSTILFINGSYWGIHNLRERFDKYYFANYHNNELEDFDLFEIASGIEVKEGEAFEYAEMNDSLRVLDLSLEQDYQRITEQVDIANFIDQHISKTYGGGRDWVGNNEQIWRAESTGNKWRWVAKDYDDAMQNVTYNSYAHATNDNGIDWPNPEWSTRLFRHLMKNRNFTIRYKNRLEYHLAHTFSAPRVVAAIDSLAAIYRPEMQRQIDRWSYPESIDLWEQSVKDMKEFAQNRPAFLLDNFNSHFPNIYENPDGTLLHPNPANNILYIDLPASSAPSVKALVYTVEGQQKMEWNLSNENQNSIDLSDFSRGTYFIHIYLDKGWIVKKLIVQ